MTVSIEHRQRMLRHLKRSERIADERVLREVDRKRRHRLTEAQARALEAKLREEGVIQ